MQRRDPPTARRQPHTQLSQQVLIRMQKNEMYAMKCRPRTVAIDVKHAHATRKTDINRTHEPLLRHRLCGTLTYRLCRAAVPCRIRCADDLPSVHNQALISRPAFSFSLAGCGFVHEWHSSWRVLQSGTSQRIMPEVCPRYQSPSACSVLAVSWRDSRTWPWSSLARS